MRLITHNFLKCNMRGVITGYPLIIECEAHEVIPSTEFDAEITRKLVPKIQWEGLLSAVRNLSLLEGDEALEKPSETDNDEIQQSFLRKLHHLLFEIHIMQGFLICPESGRRFPVVDGIPNMLLHEDEV